STARRPSSGPLIAPSVEVSFSAEVVNGGLQRATGLAPHATRVRWPPPDRQTPPPAAAPAPTGWHEPAAAIRSAASPPLSTNRRTTRPGSHLKGRGCGQGLVAPCWSGQGAARAGRRGEAAARSIRPPPCGRSDAPKSSA